jgi:hypothetical protein
LDELIEERLMIALEGCDQLPLPVSAATAPACAKPLGMMPLKMCVFSSAPAISLGAAAHPMRQPGMP